MTVESFLRRSKMTSSKPFFKINVLITDYIQNSKNLYYYMDYFKQRFFELFAELDNSEKRIINNRICDNNIDLNLYTKEKVS